MYQHMRLYELSASTKVLLTGFILVIAAAGVVALASLYYVCKDVDGKPGISFDDIHTSIRGASTSILEDAVAHPEAHGLGGVSKGDLRTLKAWCEGGGPWSDFKEVHRILSDSDFGRTRATRRDPDKVGPDKPTALSDEKLNRKYRRLRALARRRPPLSDQQLTVGIALYLLLTSLVFLGLGVLFVRTSMFEKRKTFFVGSTFIMIAACPVMLWLAREHTTCIYLLLLSLLLLVVCFAVFALVALFDIWFRRTMT